jgi:pyrroloquinoline-quinone synthase
MTISALSSDAFVVALRGQSERYWHAHPFHLRWHRGELDDDAVRSWVVNRWYYQKSLPQKDAAIIANCPEGAVRRRWLERIVYQDGHTEGEGGLADWLRLAEAVGLSEAEVLSESNVVPGVRFATDAYVTFARTRPWIEAIAASLTELFSPDLMKERMAAIERHYSWIDRQGLQYFSSRMHEGKKDASFALDVVVTHCTSSEQQDAALAALSFKCDVLWAMLDAIENANVAAAR